MCPGRTTYVIICHVTAMMTSWIFLHSLNVGSFCCFQQRWYIYSILNIMQAWFSIYKTFHTYKYISQLTKIFFKIMCPNVELEKVVVWKSYVVQSSLEFLHVTHYMVGTVLSALGFLPIHVGPLRDLWLSLELAERELLTSYRDAVICQLVTQKYSSFLSELKLYLIVGSHWLAKHCSIPSCMCQVGKEHTS